MSSEAAYPCLQKIGILNNEGILMKNKENVEEIVSSILRGTFEDLQLVVDFDYTLTRGHFNNETSHCSWGILDNSGHMPPSYREKSNELYKKYFPIEIDPVMSDAEKIPCMIEWYTNISALLKTCNLNKKVLRDMVVNSNVKLREDTDKMFEKLKEEGVPLLIFSAGMGDVLEHVMWHFKLYSDNVKVVSNFFEYNDEGVMVGFSGDLIHMFNKNENAAHHSDYFSSLEKRTNVVLMGDSVGDTKMAQGVPAASSVLKIGFFNREADDSRLQNYVDAYDIVLVKDQSMKVANDLLRHIRRL